MWLGPTALKLFEYSSLVFLCLSAPSHKIFFAFKTYVVRRRTKTQKYKGALFEQLESNWAEPRSVETKQKRKQDKKTRHRDQNKVNK